MTAIAVSLMAAACSSLTRLIWPKEISRPVRSSTYAVTLREKCERHPNLRSSHTRSPAEAHLLGPDWRRSGQSNQPASKSIRITLSPADQKEALHFPKADLARNLD